MNYSLQIIKALGALIGVLGIFYLIVKLVKNKNILNQTNQIKVLERCYLNSDQRICLVKVVDEIWLVTASGDKIEFVEKIDIAESEVLSDQQASSWELLKFFKTANNEDENDEI